MTPRKPRKMPKNQRAYKTPSGKKRRLVRVHDRVELTNLQTGEGCVGTPALVAGADGWYVDADQLRKWRALRNPPTSTGEQ